MNSLGFACLLCRTCHPFCLVLLQCRIVGLFTLAVSTPFHPVPLRATIKQEIVFRVYDTRSANADLIVMRMLFKLSCLWKATQGYNYINCRPMIILKGQS